VIHLGKPRHYPRAKWIARIRSGVVACHPEMDVVRTGEIAGAAEPEGRLRPAGRRSDSTTGGASGAMGNNEL